VRSGALNNSCTAGKVKRLSSRQRFIIRREGQRIQSMDLPLRPAAILCSSSGYGLWSLPEDALANGAIVSIKMLTAIEHQQHSSVA